MCNLECNHQQFGYIYMYIIYISPPEVWCEAHLLARNAPLSRTPKGCGPIWFQGSDKQIHTICLLQLKRVPIVPKEQMPNTVYIYTCFHKAQVWPVLQSLIAGSCGRHQEGLSGVCEEHQGQPPGVPGRESHINICIIYLYTHTQSFTRVSMHGYVCRHTHASLVYISYPYIDIYILYLKITMHGLKRREATKCATKHNKHG